MNPTKIRFLFAAIIISCIFLSDFQPALATERKKPNWLASCPEVVDVTPSLPTPETVFVAQPTPEPVVANRVDIFKDTINNESSTVFVSVSGGNQTVFSPEDTVGKSWSEIIFGSTVFPMEDNTKATVGVIEVTATSRKTESTTFEGRKTAEEVSSILAQKNLTLLQLKINKLLMLLDDWVK